MGAKSEKSAEQDLTDHPMIKRINAVRLNAFSQKKRAKILVYAAAIESDLGELFAKLFVGSGGIRGDRLLNSRKASSLDFSTQIELAYRLGLISHRLRCHLDMIRDFRNECAHLEEDFDFANLDHRSRINGAYLELSDDTRKVFECAQDDYEAKFDTISTICISQLQGCLEVTDKTKEATLEVCYR